MCSCIRTFLLSSYKIFFHFVVIKKGTGAFSSVLLWANSYWELRMHNAFLLLSSSLQLHRVLTSAGRVSRLEWTLRHILVQRLLVAMPQVPGQKCRRAFHVGWKPAFPPHGDLKWCWVLQVKHMKKATAGAQKYYTQEEELLEEMPRDTVV